MPRIAWIEDNDASGPIADVYDIWKQANPGRDGIPEILKCFSARPDFLKQVMEFSYNIHFSDGHLTRRIKEMIATFVSALNRCEY
ncbi:MAG: hypothetical protein CMJ78_05715 [Planctomycetaceae bacterium]|nr:hypothetical protein [Planctomycetaceae bacterium]